MADIEAFLAARDLLLANRTDVAAARAARNASMSAMVVSS
jgi:hypothetical protein